MRNTGKIIVSVKEIVILTRTREIFRVWANLPAIRERVKISKASLGLKGLAKRTGILVLLTGHDREFEYSSIQIKRSKG